MFGNTVGDVVSGYLSSGGFGVMLLIFGAAAEVLVALRKLAPESSLRNLWSRN